MKQISNQPPKGTSDWLPEEFKIRQYIFDTWRKVCQSYGFEEYLTPLVESAEVYRAKSGEDVGGKELVTFKDLGGRELSIRPEMTPSVTRLVSKIYDSYPKPIKFFSIANYMRNEKPQRGRNREFWQLNFDVFGSESLNADIEIMQLSLDIILAFKAPKKSFVLNINSRKLIDDLFAVLNIKEKNRVEVVRILDKKEKLSEKDFDKRLKEVGLSSQSIRTLKIFINAKSLSEIESKIKELKVSVGLLEIKQALSILQKLGYGDYIAFKPGIIRGFDYYDGLVFEVFDNHKDNKRALFGGGRYNGLAEIFGKKSFSACGCAPGDETTKLFLESWKLLDKIPDEQEKYYLPIIDKSLESDCQKLAKKLRKDGKLLELGYNEQNIGKALSYADKKSFCKVILLGSDEKKKKKYKVKDLKTGQESFVKM